MKASEKFSSLFEQARQLHNFTALKDGWMVLSDTGIVKMQNLYPHVNKATKKQRKDELSRRKIFPSFLCPQALLTFQV